jgi:hypothetical protein
MTLLKNTHAYLESRIEQIAFFPLHHHRLLLLYLLKIARSSERHESISFNADQPETQASISFDPE